MAEYPGVIETEEHPLDCLCDECLTMTAVRAELLGKCMTDGAEMVRCCPSGCKHKKVLNQEIDEAYHREADFIYEYYKTKRAHGRDPLD